MKYEKQIAEAIHPHVEDFMTLDEVIKTLEKPKSDDHGDLAFPTFQLARHYKRAPQEIAEELIKNIKSPLILKAESVGPYINFFYDRETVAKEIISDILEQGAHFGNSELGDREMVVLDMSSPNIAKPMSMGHLRSTVIGNALSNIYQKLGYRTEKINHLGDWGTQFGKLICAYKLWGNEDAVRANPIQELNELYVRFHEEAEEKPELEDEGRRWFKRLEDGDEEAREIWSWFHEESLKEFNKVYERLSVEFDSYKGEAFFNDKMDEVIEILEEKGLLKEDQGAKVVFLDEYDLNPALIQKQDGATLYMTRDLAAALYRHRQYAFHRALYVVGQDQSYHFQQLRAVLKEMDYDWAKDVVHIPFGLISIDGEKMSTRRGKVVLLNDVLDEATEKAFNQISEKNPGLENKEEVAEQVGIGAVIFNDLHNERTNNFDFDLDNIVQFEGETGPYVQYARARALSIIRKAEADGLMDEEVQSIELDNTYSWNLVRTLGSFHERLRYALRKEEPSVIARHAIRLATAFNQFYAHVRVLDDSPKRRAYLALLEATTIQIKESLRILGIDSPDAM